MSYQNVVCGVDGSPEATEAVREAARIADPSATMRLVNAIRPWFDLRNAPVGQQLATARRLEREAEQILAEARSAADLRCPVETLTGEGWASQVLLAEVADDLKCLLALGPPAQGRFIGILAEDSTASLLQRAPCSVLVARRPADPAAFPSHLVVGVDGSRGSEAAFAVASELRERHGAVITPVVARGGKGIDIDGVGRILRDYPFEVDDASPANALRSAAADADLVIVGSRGLHGARALGSVSERVVHTAVRSVLIVRGIAADQ
ncbi:MAG TPA: universal stress protein [Gaiellaceae bacterium]|nr:universal stress protein [Gaiellaceae bacterium]